MVGKFYMNKKILVIRRFKLKINDYVVVKVEIFKIAVN
jgi:hypothetical protein